MTSKYNQFVDTVSSRDNSEHKVPMRNVRNGHQTTTMVQIQNAQLEFDKQFGWCHFIMSIVTFIIGGLCCCNPAICVFSVLGMVYSGNAYSSHGDKAWGRSRNQNSVAQVFWIIALVLTFLAVAVGIIVIIKLSNLYTTVPQNGDTLVDQIYNQD